MKRKKRKKLKSYPQSDSAFEYQYNSAGNTTSDGPWMQRNGMVFGEGGDVNLTRSKNKYTKAQPYTTYSNGMTNYEDASMTPEDYDIMIRNKIRTQAASKYMSNLLGDVSTYQDAEDMNLDKQAVSRAYPTFAYGGIVPPEEVSTVGQNAYRDMLMKRRGGRLRYLEGGGMEGDFGGKQQQQQPQSSSGTNYGNYAIAGVNAYNAYNQASQNPNMTSGQQTGAGINAAVDTAASAVPVYGQIYGLAKTGSNLNKSLIPKDNSKESQTAHAINTPVHETVINHAAEGNWWDAAGSLFSGGMSDNLNAYFNPKKTPGTEVFDPAQIQRSVNSQYNDSYLAGTKGIANNQVARRGGRLYARGGMINRLPGGFMVNQGNGIQTAVGNRHEHGGIAYGGDSEIEGGEHVLNNDYVLTDMPGSEPMMETSISRRFNKNLNAISDRNPSEVRTLGTERLKTDSIIKNEEYLAGTKGIANTQMSRKGGRLRYQNGGLTEYGLDPEYQARAERSLGPNWASVLGISKVNPYSQPNEQGNSQIPRIDYNNVYNELYAPGITGGTPSTLNQRSSPYGALMAPQDYNFMGDVFNNAKDGIQDNNPVNSGSNAVNNPISTPAGRGNSYARARYGLNNPRVASDQTSGNKGSGNSGAGRYLSYLQYAKPLADLYGALQKPARLKADNYKIPYAKPHLLTDEESLREINTGYHTGLYNLKNSGNYSRGAQVALAGQRMKASAGSRERLANQNAGILNQNEGMNREIDAKNAGTRLGVDQFNIASNSKKNEYLSQLGVDLSNIGMMQDIRNKYPEYYRTARKGGRLSKMKKAC